MVFSILRNNQPFFTQTPLRARQGLEREDVLRTERKATVWPLLSQVGPGGQVSVLGLTWNEDKREQACFRRRKKSNPDRHCLHWPQHLWQNNLHVLPRAQAPGSDPVFHQQSQLGVSISRFLKKQNSHRFSEWPEWKSSSTPSLSTMTVRSL